jgi:D-alanyl-D-alanine carboxypeptidase (penicillin-binding protein 5/6)
MKKLLKIFLPLWIFLLSFNITYAETDEPADITAESCILIDAASGKVLFEKDSDRQKMFPASTTKIMTAILALEMGDLDQVMTASQAAVNDIGKDGSNIGIMAGEQIKLRNLLDALLISSANETANIIAENLCPTRQEFVDLMNKKAKELGALDTHFVNPCGAHEDDHYTTASDLAKIARYAMTNPKFREIVDKDNFQMPPTNKHSSWPVLGTTNKLMQSNKNDLYIINGIKTGYTVPAGYNLVSSAVGKDGMELIAVVMGVRNDGAKDNVKKFSKELLDYGFDNYSLVSIQQDNKVYRKVDVGDAEDTLPLELVTKGEVSGVLPKDRSQWDFKEIPHINGNISAPVNEGDRLGYVDYQIKGESIGRVDLVASRSVKQKPQAAVASRLTSLLDNTVIRVALAIAAISLFFIILRKVLRTISRRVNARRYNRL